MGRRKKQTYLEAETPQVREQADILSWETAIYARLSVENSKKDDDGASIEEQVAICKDYIEEHPYLHLHDVYVDNGWTGTNTDRPAFQRMLDDIGKGKIKAMVIKDFSRFTRDYIEGGNLLENVFPFFGVRFISVSDRYDSFETDGSAESLLIPLKNLVNTYYSIDISQKVSTAVHTKQLAGEHIPSMIPYGYRKSETQAYRFEPDPETRDIVTRIFHMRADGVTISEIARTMNKEGIPSPGQVRFRRDMTKDPRYEHSEWSPALIKQITMNPTYLGHLVFGRMPTALYLGKPNYKYEPDKSKWRVLKNMHEPLTDQDTFDRIEQMRLSSAKKWNDSLKKTEKMRKKHPPLFHGYVFCGDCGKGLRYHWLYYDKRIDNGNYECPTGMKTGRCTGTHTLTQDRIKEIVGHVIDDHMAYLCVFDDVLDRLKDRRRETAKQKELRKQIQVLSVKVKQRHAKRERLYEDFTEGILSPEDYMTMKQKYDGEYQELSRELNRLQSEQARTGRMLSAKNAWLTQFKKYQGHTEVTPELLEALVEKILVFQDTDGRKRVEVVLKYQDEFRALLDAEKELQRGGKR